MKIEKLTKNKIRIILDIDDLIEKNIDIFTLLKNTNGTYEFFKKILKQAQKEIDFNIDGFKLWIDAIVSSDGYFILTFTKFKSTKMQNYISTIAIYKFETFDEFNNFCTYIKNSRLKSLKGFAKNISLYEYESKYFLVFSEIDTNFKYSSLFYISISEFAKLISNSDSFSGRLNEYGKVIFKNKKTLELKKLL